MGVGEEKKNSKNFIIAKKTVRLRHFKYFYSNTSKNSPSNGIKHKQNGKAIDERKFPQKNIFALSGEQRHLGPAC